MTVHLGYYNTSSTRTHVGFQFSTHAATGANVAPSSAIDAADIRIYRAADGAAFSATQRSSASGITCTSPFDSLTGFHDVDIDLTDNTDAGFYAAGYRYAVVLAPNDETIDSIVLTGVVLAYFEIGKPQTDVRQFGGTDGTFASGRPEVNTTLIEGSDATNQIRDSVVDDATRIDASALNTATVTTIPAIDAKTTNLPSDPADASVVAGRFDTLDASVADLPTNAELATALAAADDAVLALVALVKAKTDNLPTDPADQSLVIAATDALLAAITALNNISTAQVQTAAAAALTAYDPPTRTEATSDKAEILTAIDGIEGGGGGAGTGANTVTITVDDGTDPLENAKIRVTSGAESYLVETDVDGEAVFALDDATWSVAITKPGYQFSPTTLVVNGNEAQTYSMTSVTITPSEAGKTTGVYSCLGADGEVEADVNVYIQMHTSPAGAGIAFDSANRTGTSDAGGVVSFTNLIKGAVYHLRRGSTSAKPVVMKIPADAGDSVNLNNILGSP